MVTEPFKHDPDFLLKEFDQNAFICPLVDFLNHSKDFNAFYDYNYKTKEFEITSRHGEKYLNFN